MRIDHHAYQRATRVAGFGLMIQVVIGLTMLIFGIVGGDTAFRFATAYVLTGVLVWVGLIVIFYQHKLERLESLEEDELAASRGGGGSVFEGTAAEESRVAARRLAFMYRWLMPVISLLYAAFLGGLAASMLSHLRSIDGPGENPATFDMTGQLGWAVAVTLGFAVLAFIFSRFVAGMAKQGAWQNLRGGAGHMVGNALVMLAVAAGIVFRFFDNNAVMLGVGYAIPIFMGLVALEIVLNFILNLYRPRVPGEVPRPAFDSKLLSLLATPDSIVRTINEAVNYQFGFDVTSSWGYKLLIRSLAGLVSLGVITLVLLNMMVIVEPQQQAVRLRGGAIVGDVHGSGVMWKLPWPVETAEVYDVARVRNLHLTSRQIRSAPVRLWTDEIERNFDVPLDPFLVGQSTLRKQELDLLKRTSGKHGVLNRLLTPDLGLSAPDQAAVTSGAENAVDATASAPDDLADAVDVGASYSLVDAEISIDYRIREDGLLDYLGFAPDTYGRRQNLTVRERAIKSLALAEVSEHLSRLSLDEVLSPGRTSLISDLKGRIQKSLDAHKTGIEVVSVNLPLVRPSGTAAASFEELGISVQAARQRKAEAERTVAASFSHWLGDAELADEVDAALRAYTEARNDPKATQEDIRARRDAVERLLFLGGGEAAQLITNAEQQRSVDLLKQRVQASRVQGELGAYRAAPSYYRQRMLMAVFKETLPNKSKYIIGIDPSRVSVDMDLKDLNPLQNIDDALLREGDPVQ